MTDPHEGGDAPAPAEPSAGLASLRDPRERFSGTAELYRKYRPSYPTALVHWIITSSGVRLADPSKAPPDPFARFRPPAPPAATTAPGMATAPAPGARPGFPAMGMGPLAGRPPMGPPPTFGRPPPPPPPDRVLDLGCGTGISTRLLAEHGLDVLGMDPNEDMLALAREQGGPTYVKGEATATGLPPQSVGLVTVAQAFHWFPVQETMAELRRIVRRGGSVAAFWNIRAETPFMTAYEALLRDKSKDYEKVPRFEDTLVAILRSPHVSRVARKEFANSQTLDREGLHGRAWSSSYVAHGVVGDDARREFDAALDALFDRFAEDGRVTFQYRSLAGVVRFG